VGVLQTALEAAPDRAKTRRRFDTRHDATAGIPVVPYGAGPRSIEEANAHRADERLPLDDLHKATEASALTLFDLLSEV